MLLLEDDCYPTEPGWERDWVAAALRHGHMNLAGGWFRHAFIGGSGTPEDPIESKMISGQCVAFSREAVQRVGYFDIRYQGYGLGHVEHSWRMARAGYGGRIDPQDPENPCYFLLDSPIHVDGTASGREEGSVARNEKVYGLIRHEGIHRWAWRTDGEMSQFLSEIDQAATAPTATRSPTAAPAQPAQPPPPTAGRYLDREAQRHRIGIAVTTFNRRDAVVSLLGRIGRMTASDHDLVVCDDGSTDGTPEAVRAAGATILCGETKGRAWNGNRGLFHLLHVRKCDVVILMDDSVVPSVRGWDLEWVEAACRYGHANTLPEHLKPELFGGGMTAESPGVSPFVDGRIMAQTAAASAFVGYMDPRLREGDHERTDFSRRFLRAGYGGFRYEDAGRRVTEMFFVINGGVKPLQARTSPASRQPIDGLPDRPPGGPVFRLPWQNDAEALSFKAEIGLSAQGSDTMSGCLFSATAYYDANPDVARAGPDALRHYLQFGANEDRPRGRSTPGPTA